MQEILKIESVDLDAQGIARGVDGKVIFIDGALTGEHVYAKRHQSKKSFDKAELTQILNTSSLRVAPKCPHFGLHRGACGGCKMQHLQMAAQIAIKQRALEDNFKHLGKVKPLTILPPMYGPSWGYRFRARLSVRFVRKKNEVLIGFHERKSPYVADMKTCDILLPAFSALLLPLRRLIASLSQPETLAQIELAAGESGDQIKASKNNVMALVLRHLAPLIDSDIDKLQQFAKAHPGVQWWLQPNGIDSIYQLEEIAGVRTPPLSYRLAEFGIEMPFRPTDFTQVNPYVNAALVSRALRFLDVHENERVIDWFCGLGNFTLPLATRGAAVLGIEGAQTLVDRARSNAKMNRDRLAEANIRMSEVDFQMRNLFEMTPEQLVFDGYADKWLIDPPREGAQSLCQALAQLCQKPEIGLTWRPPKRIVYVSCSPATLARDAGILVNEAGYTLKAAGVVNMFAHTAHVESMAIFEL